jgi:hypothetical protein
MSGKSEHHLPKCGERRRFEPLLHPSWLVPARGVVGLSNVLVHHSWLGQ